MKSELINTGKTRGKFDAKKGSISVQYTMSTPGTDFLGKGESSTFAIEKAK